MALPKISNKLTVAPTAVPSVQIVKDNPQSRVALQGLQSLDARVAQLNRMFISQGQKQAETMGLKYGAANAVTEEQIKLAQETGQPVTQADLVGDDTSINIFQQAARKGALAVTESRFTGAARRELTDVFIDASTKKNVDPRDLQQRLDDVVASYAGSMNSVDPLSGAKLDASLSLVANSMMQTYSRTYATRQASADRAAALARVPDHLSGIRAVISAGGDNYQAKVDALVTALDNDLNNAGVTATKQASVMNSVKTAIQNQVFGVVQNYASGLLQNDTDALVVIKQFERGEFKDKHINSLVAGLRKDRPDQYVKLESKLRTQVSERANFIANTERMKVESLGRDEDRAQREFNRAIVAGDIDTARKIFPMLKPEDQKNLAPTLDTGGRIMEGDPYTLNFLTNLINNPAYSVSEVRNAINSAVRFNKIKVSEANGYFEKLDTLKDTRVTLVKTTALNRLRMTQGELEQVGPDVQDEVRRKKAIYYEFVGKLSNAMLTDPSLNPVDFLDREFDTITKRENRRVLDDALATATREVKYITGRLDTPFPSVKKEDFKDLSTLRNYQTLIRNEINRGTGGDTGYSQTVINRLIVIQRALASAEDAVVYE